LLPITLALRIPWGARLPSKS